MAAGPYAGPRRNGLTLIELLLAMAVVALVLGIVFSLYHTVSLAVVARRLRANDCERATRALKEITEDLTSLWAAPRGEQGVRLKLSEGGDSNRSETSFCTFRLPEGETDPRWAEVIEVRYRLEEARLLCEWHPLVGPGFDSVKTNVLLTGVSAFRVSFFDGREWKTEWKDSSGPPVPRAARVELDRAGGPRTFRATTWIPAGRVFTSRLERAPSP